MKRAISILQNNKKWKRNFHSLFNVIQQQTEKNQYGFIENKHNQ
jgi:hypothetical protein